MALVNAESKISALIVAYLETRRTDMSLPDSDELPFLAEPTVSEFTIPSVHVNVPDFKLTHPKCMDATVQIVLHTRRDPTGTDGTTLTNEHAYIAGIRSALSDETSDGFYAYITGLPTEADWRLDGFKLTGGTTELDTESLEVRRITTANCRFRSTETTV